MFRWLLWLRRVGVHVYSTPPRFTSPWEFIPDDTDSYFTPDDTSMPYQINFNKGDTALWVRGVIRQRELVGLANLGGYTVTYSLVDEITGDVVLGPVAAEFEAGTYNPKKGVVRVAHQNAANEVTTSAEHYVVWTVTPPGNVGVFTVPSSPLAQTKMRVR